MPIPNVSMVKSDRPLTKRSRILASVPEAAFLHNPSGSGVVNEVVAPEGEEAHLVETPVDHPPESLRPKALVPVRLPYPVANLGILLPYLDIALGVVIIADAADGFPGLLEFHGEGMAI